jgi:YgiT-type zinc finger domain-containing protein
MEFTKHFNEMLEERDIKRKRRLRFMKAKDLDSKFDAGEDITEFLDLSKARRPIEKCLVCGGEVKNMVVDKILHGGNHTAVLQIHAEVCLHCGERLYTEEVVRLFEKIRNKLKRQDLSGFDPSGQAFTVDKEWLKKQMQPSAESGG